MLSEAWIGMSKQDRRHRSPNANAIRDVDLALAFPWQRNRFVFESLPYHPSLFLSPF